MIKTIFDIPIYDWNVTYLIVETKDDIPELLAWLEIFQTAFQDDINETFDTIKNAGLTYIDRVSQKFLVIIFPSTSKTELLSTIGHEKRHLEDFILEELGIFDKEAAGYLAGYLTKKMFNLNENRINK